MTMERLLVGGMVALAATAVAAETVTLAPAAGVTTNVLQVYSGDTAVEIAGPGTVSLNPANSHTGGTTLSGGTLAISGNNPGGSHSPVGAGTFTVSGGTLLGSGTFGGDITGTDVFSIEAPDGWAISGDNSFSEPVTLADGSFEISGGSTTFGKHFYVGVGGADVSFTMSGGSVSMNANNVQLSYGKYAKSSFTMTGGSFDVNGKNVVTGYQVTYATNTFEVSGDAVFYNIGTIYPYAGNGNVMNIYVHDGGMMGFRQLKKGNKDATKATLLVDGGILRNDTTGSSVTSTYKWIGNTDGSKEQLTSFKIGPKGATFTTDNGDAAGVAQIQTTITAEPAGAGETPIGVTISGGRFAYYKDTNYEGPTRITDGAVLYVSSAGTIPSGSEVIVDADAMLRLQADKTVSSLSLKNGAALGFGIPNVPASSPVLTVSGVATLPDYAQISLFSTNTPAGVAKNDNGTYAVLNVPAAYANALSDVVWSCATAVSGKAYTFSVATSGSTATLSMTIDDDPNAGEDSITGTSTLSADNYAVASDITINNSGTLVAKKNIYGSATGGLITINDGGTLDVSASNGAIRPVNESGNSFHLYLNEGGTLVVDAIAGVQTAGQARDEAQATAMFHFNGGTIYPSFGSKPNDGLRYLLNYQTAVVGEKGVIIDLSRLNRPAGYTRWVRSTLQGKVNHDPDCAGADGGINIRGIRGEKACVCFGSRFSDSTLDGDIQVECGAAVAVNASALAGKTMVFAPGSRFRPYNNTATIQIGDLVVGTMGASEPVAFDGSNSKVNYNIVVSGSINILSTVEFSVCGGWDADSFPVSGVYTALVYQASCSVDPSFFQLPAGCVGTLTASEVTLSGGDYDGWKALVVTIDNDIAVTGSASYPTPKTVSSDVSCSSIVVGGSWNGEADPVCESSLTVSGNVTASTGLYLGYDPAPGVDKDNWHQGFLTLNGGSITTPLLYSIYRPGMTGSNDSECRFGCKATVNGGLLDVAGDVRLAYNRSKNGNNLYSQLTVNGGRVEVGGKFYLLYDNTQGAYSAPGSIVLNGGEVDVTGVIDMTRNAQKAANNTAYAEKFGIWLNGGILKAENIMMTATAATAPQLVFNGGTYMPYGAATANRTMQELNKAYVSTNGAVISTANLPDGETYTIAQNLLTDPALNGATDGGLCKIGAGTLALSGVNTFTGPTVVQEGTLVVANADALSSSVEVAGGAVLDLDGGSVSVSTIKASGCVAGDLTVTGAIVAVGGSILSVDGKLTLEDGAAVDFAAIGASPDVWTPVAAASGKITEPTSRFRALNAGSCRRCEAVVRNGVLYVRPVETGLSVTIR